MMIYQKIFICEKYISSERALNSLSNDYKFSYSNYVKYHKLEGEKF